MEIERKFLVKDQAYKANGVGRLLKQAYLYADSQKSVRIRLDNGIAFLTVKGPRAGAGRPEFEYEIPFADAEEIIATLCEKPSIEKHRYTLDYAGLTWEIDEFHGDNEGLVVAEVELESENQTLDKPAWIGREVTDDPRFLNSNLFQNPYQQWKETKPMDTIKPTDKTIDDYIAQFQPEIREILIALRKIIQAAAPDATEKISWQMPTFFLHGNLVHFAAHKNHIGFYPGASGIATFQDELAAYKSSKGAVQFPIGKPLPEQLIGKIVEFRVAENRREAEAKGKKKK